MNKYESVCILAQELTDEKVAEMIVKIENKIREFSKAPIKVENLGKKKLAYEIKNNTEGIYLDFYFKAKSEDIQELQRFYRISEEIIKFIVIREDSNNE